MSTSGKILFYSFTARAFQSTLIGHLHELATRYPVVLLTEQMPEYIRDLLSNNELFPGLESMVPVDQFSARRCGLRENRRLYRLASDVLNTFRPTVVVTATDIHSQFDMYLTRLARCKGSMVVCVQPTMSLRSLADVRALLELTKAASMQPRWLPQPARILAARARKWCGQIYYHMVLATRCRGEHHSGARQVGSCTTGQLGMTSSDVQIVFGERDPITSCVSTWQAGVSTARLGVLPHHWVRETRKVFERVFQSRIRSSGEGGRRTAVLLLPTLDAPVGRVGREVGSIKDRREQWRELFNVVATGLPGWKIVLKPHPDVEDIEAVRTMLPRSLFCEIASPQDAVEPYVLNADLVIGFPLSTSTALYLAALINPARPVLSLDPDAELLGDTFADCEGIDHVKSTQVLREHLEKIRVGAWCPAENRPLRAPDRSGVWKPHSFAEVIEELMRSADGSPEPGRRWAYSSSDTIMAQTGAVRR